MYYYTQSCPTRQFRSVAESTLAEGNPIEATHRWVLHLARILPDRRLGSSFHRGHVSFGEAEGRPEKKVFFVNKLGVSSQCLKITPNVSFEFFVFGNVHQHALARCRLVLTHIQLHKTLRFYSK